MPVVVTDGALLVVVLRYSKTVAELKPVSPGVPFCARITGVDHSLLAMLSDAPVLLAVAAQT